MNKNKENKKITICYFGFYQPGGTRNEIYIEGLKRNGVKVIECSVSSSAKLLKYWYLFKKHWKIRKKYDLIIVGHLNKLVGHSTHFVVPFARLISRKKIIYNALCSAYEAAIISRGVSKNGSLDAKFYWLTDYLSCIFSSLILVETEEQKKFFIKHFKIKEKKCIRIWTGANDKKFFIEPVKKNKKFTAVFRGWFLPETGIEHILKAAKKLENENVDFLILGRPKTEKIKQRIQNIKSDNLKIITDYFPFDKLRKLMLSAHVSLGQFGDNERIQRTIPYKAFESLALGIAYLTGEAAGVKELLTNRENCLFARVADPKDIAQKILELKNNPELRKKIAENGYKLYKEKLTPKVLGKELLNIIRTEGLMSR